MKSLESHIVAAYRTLGNGTTKQLIKNAASFFVHRLSRRVEEVVFDGERIRLYRNRMIGTDQLTRDIAGYNLRYPLRPGDVVVDAGAYTGFYAIYAALKVGPEGRVIAFEPDPYNRMMLKRNVRLSGLGNVTCVDKGLYSKDAVLAFDVQGFGSHVVEGAGRQKFLNHVQVVTLDSELRRMRIPAVDFVKMDVEGTEIEALKGCVHTIAQCKAIEFAVATYHLVQGQQTAVSVESFFRSQGMHALTAYTLHLTTFGYRADLTEGRHGNVRGAGASCSQLSATE